MGNEKVKSRLRLHDEWRWIVGHAWSFRFLGLAAVLSGAQAALPLFMDHPPLPRRLFAVVVFLIVSLAMIFSIIVQKHPPVIVELPQPVPAPLPEPATVAAPAPVPAIVPAAAPEPAPPSAPVAAVAVAAPAQAPIAPAVTQ